MLIQSDGRGAEQRSAARLHKNLTSYEKRNNVFRLQPNIRIVQTARPPEMPRREVRQGSLTACGHFIRTRDLCCPAAAAFLRHAMPRAGRTPAAHSYCAARPLPSDATPPVSWDRFEAGRILWPGLSSTGLRKPPQQLVKTYEAATLVNKRTQRQQVCLTNTHQTHSLAFRACNAVPFRTFLRRPPLRAF